MKQKNVIWILGDQHRAQALSCNGDPNVNTPHLDRLSVEGVNFRNAISGFPLCCPFRGSMLTSRYPHKCVPGHEYRMPEDQKTIAHAFNENGYDTAYFGKWHLDGFHEREGRGAFHIVPPQRRGGFKTWVGYENNNSQWDSWVHGSHGQFLKMSPYEESIRVPFIIGGCTPMGYDGFRCGGSPALMNHVDIAPTSLGLCGIEKPDWMVGFDYSGVRVHARTLKEMPDSAYIQTVIPTKHGDSVDQPFRAIVTNDGWKYVCFERQQWLMFNLNEDPYEQVNLAFNVAYGGKRKALNERLAKWIADTDDSFVLPCYS